jgi:hypothetical protein
MSDPIPIWAQIAVGFLMSLTNAFYLSAMIAGALFVNKYLYLIPISLLVMIMSMIWILNFGHLPKDAKTLDVVLVASLGRWAACLTIGLTTLAVRRRLSKKV